MKKVFIYFLFIIISSSCISCNRKETQRKTEEKISQKETSKEDFQNQQSIEDAEDTIDRIVYLNGQNVSPGYYVWERLISRPEIESYTIMGMTDAKLDKKNGYFVMSDTRLETDGVHSMGLQIISGDELNSNISGKCIISEEFANNNHKKIGEIITVKIEEKESNFLISGIFSKEEPLWENNTNTSLLMNTIFLTIKDFISLVGKEEKNSIMVTSVICKSSKEKETFLTQANEVLKEYHMKFLPLLKEELYHSENNNISQNTN